MRILISGGTGFIGTTLTARLAAQGNEVSVLTRSAAGRTVTLPGVSMLEGDPTKRGPWQKRVPEHDAIINLAGAPIFRRWTRTAKKMILSSRIDTTSHLVEALSPRKGRETHFLSASAVGYYGFRGDEWVDESSPAGDDFLAHVAAQWEAAALKARAHGARTVPCRFGLVFGRQGGVLSRLIPLVRLRLGGPWGKGRQWLSWVHEEDLAEAIVFVLGHPDIEGPVNIVSPNPVRNAEMMRLLREHLGAGSVLPSIPDSLMRLVLGEFSSVLLGGQRVAPARLMTSGFGFRYQTLDAALGALRGSSA